MTRRHNIPFSARRRALRRRILRIKIMFAVIAVGLVVGGLGWLSRIDAVAIDSVTVAGNKVIATNDIRDIVLNMISGDYFFLFPKSDILLYPKHAIAQNIASTFARVNGVTVKTVYPHTVAVNISERTPKALWCGSTLPASGASGSCYLVDDTGFVFAHAPALSDNAYPAFYGPLASATSTATEPIGSQYLSQAQFSALLSFHDGLAKEGMKGDVIAARPGGDYALYLTSGGKILFNTHFDLDTVFRNIVLAVQTKEKERSDLFSVLNYIDARFADAGKIYFKFK